MSGQPLKEFDIKKSDDISIDDQAQILLKDKLGLLSKKQFLCAGITQSSLYLSSRKFGKAELLRSSTVTRTRTNNKMDET